MTDTTAPTETSAGAAGVAQADRSLYATIAARASRPVVGWALVVIGAIAILLGYLGVANEALVAKQVPYLLSGGIFGMTLVAVGAFLLGTDDLHREMGRLDAIERRVDDLHRVLLDHEDADGS